MQSTRLASCLFVVGLFALGGCECDGPAPSTCTRSDECTAGMVCIDGRCTAPRDAAITEASVLDVGGGDATSIDAGADTGTSCPSRVLCGSGTATPVCCADGEECLSGSCVPACASGVRCGADQSTCCGASEVCVSNACRAPGDSCTDSFQCPIGEFCEPTLSRCLPQYDPVTCRTEPVFGDFDPVLERSFHTANVAPDCLNPISMPLVIDLDSTSAVDDARRPEIVQNFACISGTTAAWQRGTLRALRVTDDGLEELWAAPNELNGRIGIAAADFDGDRIPEIVGVSRVEGSPTPTAPNQPLMFSATGTIIARGRLADGSAARVMLASGGAPTIADLDLDGTPEILFGAMAFRSDLTLYWSREPASGVSEGSNGGYVGGIATVADIDGDGRPEVIVGRNAYEDDGTPKWTAHTATGPITDGYPAIANFDADAQPEVVLVTRGTVYLVDGMSGEVQWGPITIPSGTPALGGDDNRGGPPTVADFDGDGQPEIGVAGARRYVVLDPMGATPILWQTTTQDVSSNATGSSVFDFEGDGAAEVVYGDERNLHVYRGSDGMSLLELPSLSATIHEYPVIADVDADGRAEIIAVANCTSCTEQQRGLFVYGDRNNRWVRTRRVWNQHAYHVTNVTTDYGTVPMVEENNWTRPGLNNYRQNVQGEGVFNAADLRVIAIEAVLSNCPSTATLRARVQNAGNLGVPSGILVTFRQGMSTTGRVLGTVATMTELLPGASTLVEIDDVALDGAPPFAFNATVDADGSGVGAIVECLEDNNTAAIGNVSCELVL